MKLAYLLLLTILLITSTTALTISDNAINDVIVTDFNSPAEFELTIIGAEPGTYNLYTLTDVRILPTNSIFLNAVANKLTIFVYPTESLDVTDYYTFNYLLDNVANGQYEEKLTVKIVNLADILTIDSDSNDPASDKMEFYVQNKENAKLENIKAKFSSVFFDIEETFTIEPYKKKVFSVDVDQDKLKTIKAGSYIIKAEFESLKGPVKIDGKIHLGTKKGIETNEDNAGLLIRSNSVTKINVGNVVETVSIKIKRNIITRLFSSFSEEPDIVERSGAGVTYTWNKRLDPAGVATIKAKTNFLIPLIIIILIVLVIIGIRRYIQTVVEVKKSVSHVKTKGGEFALRVRLNIKAKKDVDNVSLIDRIPAIVKVYKKFGTIRPTSIDAKTRRLQWDLGDLKAGEERALSYMVYSKIGIVGKFSLPAALAVFEKGADIHETESNQVFFLSEQTRS